jgi:hypothetical protein
LSVWTGIHSEQFDILNPPSDFKLEPGSAVLTIHSLEQLGNRHGAWLDFLLRSKPGVVINYEPILEFYDKENLLDYLALLYSQKRGYLTGYYSRLRELEKEGRINILDAFRPHLGGILHESSLIVWQLS